MDRRVGIIAAAIPPIVVSAHPEKDAATSPNFGELALPLLLLPMDGDAVGVAALVWRAQRGQ